MHRPRALSSALAVGIACGAVAGCGPGRAVAEGVVEAYVFAVQRGDWDRLFCLSAGAAGSADLGTTERDRRAAFASWAQAELDRYLNGREAGFVDLDRSPIALVKTLTLGKGTYFRVERAVPAGEDGAIVDMDVRLAYQNVDLTELSPGTGFFVASTPPGSVAHVRVPRFRGEVTVDVLDHAPVRWTLIREPERDGCEAGWKVNGASLRTDDTTVRTVTWVF